MQEASGASWKRLREGMESAWDDMTKAFRDAADRFRWSDPAVRGSIRDDRPLRKAEQARPDRPGSAACSSD